MKKLSPKIFIALFALGLFGSAAIAHAQTANAVASTLSSLTSITFDVVGLILSPAAYAIMKLMSYVTILGGTALNAAAYYTIVEMAQNFSAVGGIDAAWTVIRDVANMGFIFVLLYASIQLILGGNGGETRKLIVNMIIAAILINFSLFFTKVVIDAANLLALTIYGAIAPTASLAGSDFLNGGISNAFAAALKLPSLLQANSLLDPKTVFTIAILISIIELIAAFVFFAVAVMLVVRYVVLIFVLIFSPIAFVSSVFPGLSGPARQWRDTLVSQAFFAPVYFLLTWVALTVAKSINQVTFDAANFADIGNASSFSAHLAPAIINYGIVIVFLIMSLVISKNYASKAGGVVSKMTSTALGWAGGASFGTVSRLGRNTIGRAGQAVADSEFLKSRPNSNLAKAALATGRGVASSSFDVRGSRGYAGISEATGTSFGKAQKGGFAENMKKQVDAEKKFAESLKPSDLVINRAEKSLDAAKKTGNQANIDAAQKEVDRLKGVSEDEVRKRKVREIREASNWTKDEKTAKRELVEMEAARLRTLQRLKTQNPNLNQEELEEKFKNEFEGELRSQMLDKKNGMDEKKAREAAEKEVGYKIDSSKSQSAQRQEAYAKKVEGRRFFGMGPLVEDETAAMEIRKKLKDKKPADKIAEEAAKIAKETTEEESGGTTPSASAPPSSGGGAPSSGGTPPAAGNTKP